MTMIAPGSYAHVTTHGIVYLDQSAIGWTWELVTTTGDKLTDTHTHRSRAAALDAFRSARGTITRHINRR